MGWLTAARARAAGRRGLGRERPAGRPPPFDDAAVLRLTDDLALVSTTDFFPPLVDDPADFGAIAAANACSDVFAMGGRVTIALNVCAFPERLPVEVINEILVAAAGRGRRGRGCDRRRPYDPLGGAHLRAGGAGTGASDRVLTKGGARSGDAVVLSKPIGTGIVLAGGSDADKASAVEGMKTLNRSSSELLLSLGSDVHAVTDVTGFGLLGHSWEVAERSGFSCGCTRERYRSTRAPPRPRNSVCVRAETSATGSTWTARLAFRPPSTSRLWLSTPRHLEGSRVG